MTTSINVAKNVGLGHWEEICVAIFWRVSEHDLHPNPSRPLLAPHVPANGCGSHWLRPYYPGSNTKSLPARLRSSMQRIAGRLSVLETGFATPGDKKWRKSLANDFRHFLSPGVEDPVSNTKSLPARLRSSMQRIIYSSRRKSEPGRKSSKEQQMLAMSATFCPSCASRFETPRGKWASCTGHQLHSEAQS